MKTRRQISLNEISLDGIFNKTEIIGTMSDEQWDKFLQTAYDNGATLLELDENEIPIRAYRRKFEGKIINFVK